VDVLETCPLLTYVSILPSVMEKIAEVVEANQLTFVGFVHMLKYSKVRFHSLRCTCMYVCAVPLKWGPINC